MNQRKIYLFVQEPIPPHHLWATDVIHGYYSTLEAACIALLHKVSCKNYNHLRVDIVTLKESDAKELYAKESDAPDSKTLANQDNQISKKLYLPRLPIDEWPEAAARLWKETLCQEKIQQYVDCWAKLFQLMAVEDPDYGVEWCQQPIAKEDEEKERIKTRNFLLRETGKAEGFWKMLNTTVEHVVNMAATKSKK